MDSLERMMEIAADACMKAAAAYAKLNSLDCGDYTRFSEIIQRACVGAFDEALADAKEACDLGMNEIGLKPDGQVFQTTKFVYEATFLASMKVAGVRAAQTYEKEIVRA